MYLDYICSTVKAAIDSVAMNVGTVVALFSALLLGRIRNSTAYSAVQQCDAEYWYHIESVCDVHAGMMIECTLEGSFNLLKFAYCDRKNLFRIAN
jgi:hypothetical protein